MERPLVLDIIETPAVSVTVAVCISSWLYILNNKLSYEDIGVSYKSTFSFNVIREGIVEDKQIWRFVTASFAHVSPIHLFFNMV